MRAENNKLIEILTEIRDGIYELQDPSALNNMDIIDKGNDIENAILVACLVIAKPDEPQKALAAAYEQVEKFRREQDKSSEEKYKEFCKEHPELRYMPRQLAGRLQDILDSDEE